GRGGLLDWQHLSLGGDQHLHSRSRRHLHGLPGVVGNDLLANLHGWFHLDDPVSTASMTFSVQNKGYSTPPAQSQSVIDCFNYKATGAGYSSIEDKTTSGTGAWSLYREAFLNGNYMCQSPGGTSCDGHITKNDVDSTQHFTDTTIPLPRANDSG